MHRQLRVRPAWCARCRHDHAARHTQHFIGIPSAGRWATTGTGCALRSCWYAAPPACRMRRNGTFSRCARTRGSGANRHLCSNAAGSARPGTLGGRTTRLGTAVWRCAAAGAVCACDLGRTLMIFDAKGEESRHGDFRLVGISESTIGKKTCKMDHTSSPDNAPSNGIRAFRRLPAGWHSSQGTPRANPTGREHSSSRRLMHTLEVNPGGQGHHTTRVA